MEHLYIAPRHTQYLINGAYFRAVGGLSFPSKILRFPPKTLEHVKNYTLNANTYLTLSLEVF